MKKILILFLSIIMLTCCIGLLACESKDAENEDNQIKTVYNSYVSYSESKGINPLSYEDWLASIKGQNGKNGTNGTNGQDGKDGIGIADMKIENGKLYVKYSNSDSYVELGQVKGADGQDAREVKSAEIDVDGNLIITFKDDTTENLGKIKDNSKCEHEYSDYVITEIGDFGYRKEFYCTKCHNVRSELYKYTDGIEYSLSKDGNSAYVKGVLNTTEKEVVLRYTYQGKPVTAIGHLRDNNIENDKNEGFYIVSENCERIIIPDSVLSIMELHAECSNLRKIIMSKNIESISEYNGNCSFMMYHILENNIEYNIFENGRYVGNEVNPYLVLVYRTENNSCPSTFKINEKCRIIMTGWNVDGKNLESLTIPASVVEIPRGLTAGLNQLSSLIVEKQNEKYYSTNNCIIEKETKTLIAGCKNCIIPTENVEIIGSSAFSQLNIKGIDIPANITSIKAWAISGCDVTEINYNGTKEQWNNIDKEIGRAMSTEWGGVWKNCELWMLQDTDGLVHCLDGDIELNFFYGYLIIG